MTPGDVIDFWFRELEPAQWFRGGDAVDERIRGRFEALPEAISQGCHDDWACVPTGRLAMILALDQFPRNLYRGQARSFSYDEKALSLVVEGLSLRVDEFLKPIERVFFYLPLEHSESMEMQDVSLERYASLVLATPIDQRGQFRNYLDYAWQHYAIIKRFGRYPHRNDILQRANTASECEFLQKPGSSF
jgi:uncharacterized protein (DUF924 family)